MTAHADSIRRFGCAGGLTAAVVNVTFLCAGLQTSGAPSRTFSQFLLMLSLFSPSLFAPWPTFSPSRPFFDPSSLPSLSKSSIRCSFSFRFQTFRSGFSFRFQTFRCGFALHFQQFHCGFSIPLGFFPLYISHPSTDLVADSCSIPTVTLPV